MGNTPETQSEEKMSGPKIIIPEDCGNSPKKRFIAAFNSAFATDDTELIAAALHDDITCVMVGDKLLKGKQAFINELNSHSEPIIKELVINTVVTHGPVAACEGTMTFKNGKKYAFCDTSRFVSAGRNIIKELKSFVIEIKE